MIETISEKYIPHKGLQRSPDELRDDSIALTARGSWQAAMDRGTTVKKGSSFGRTLEQYREILSHRGAPDIVEVASKLPDNFTFVDLGCGAGVALAKVGNLFPASYSIGIDIRNVLENTLIEPDYSNPREVREIFGGRISFLQDSMREINRLVPTCYNLLVCVDSFYDESNSLDFRTLILERFYRGLKPGGIAEVFAEVVDESQRGMTQFLTDKNIPHQIFEGDKEVLIKYGLVHPNNDPITIVLGPKV